MQGYGKKRNEFDDKDADVKAILKERYVKIRKVHEGGQGAIYKATDKSSGQVVALKILREEIRSDPSAMEHFLMEARMVKSIKHPGLVSIFDIVEGDILYMVMEFIEGMDLAEYMEAKKIGLAFFMKIALEICDALEAAHEAGIIHRDIKLDNILITKDKVIKVADFGLAGLSQGMTGLIPEEKGLGAPRYMAPEQIQGQTTDHRSDIYSLGISFYKMLTGQFPFPEGDIGYRQIHERPKPPSMLNPEIPLKLDAIIMKCLEKKIDARYQDVGSIKKELGDLKLT